MDRLKMRSYVSPRILAGSTSKSTVARRLLDPSLGGIASSSGSCRMVREASTDQIERLSTSTIETCSRRARTRALPAGARHKGRHLSFLLLAQRRVVELL